MNQAADARERGFYQTAIFLLGVARAYRIREQRGDQK
jgi:hypothetical protein